MATDIVDKELKGLRNARWEKAFQKGNGEQKEEKSQRDDINRKATIVIEHSKFGLSWHATLFCHRFLTLSVDSDELMQLFKHRMLVIQCSIGTSIYVGMNVCSKKCTRHTKVEDQPTTLLKIGTTESSGFSITI